jgi:hypothetical protein
VEQLFPVTPPETWNLLIDLRRQLLAGNDWASTLNTFLECRKALETDHYLPFYRLRRLLTASLRFDVGDASRSIAVDSLADLLRRGHRSLADMTRAVRREIFEHQLDLPTAEVLPLRLVERV